MVKIVKRKPLMTVEESDAFEGKFISQNDCKELITYDADIVDAESGKVLAKFRKGVIPANVQRVAYESFLPAVQQPTDSRPTAGGAEDKKKSGTRVKQDGTISRQTVAKQYVYSGVAGYYDRSPRFPTCRLTAFNKHHFEKFVDAYPIVKLVDNFYSKLMPKEYKAQRKIADKTAQDFVIKDTSFTTVTVNKNYSTAVHKDAGDLKEGFGNLVALRKGTYTGCNLVLVRWGIGFDLQNGDLLLMNVHEWHGNTPMIKADKDATRMSLVMYYREHMQKCGSAKQELNRAKKRKKGDKIR